MFEPPMTPEGKSYFQQVFQRQTPPTWDFDDGVPRDSLPEFCPQFWNGRKSVERGDTFWNLQQILREISPGFTENRVDFPPFRVEAMGFFWGVWLPPESSNNFLQMFGSWQGHLGGKGWTPRFHRILSPTKMAIKWQSDHVLESLDSLFGKFCLGVWCCFKDVSIHFIFSKTVSFFPHFLGWAIWGCRVELLFLMKTVATSHGPKIWIIHSIIPWYFAIHHVFFVCPYLARNLKFSFQVVEKIFVANRWPVIMIPASVRLTASRGLEGPKSIARRWSMRPTRTMWTMGKAQSDLLVAFDHHNLHI